MTNGTSMVPERVKGSRRASDVAVQVLIMLLLLAVLVIATGLVNKNFFQPFLIRGMARDIAILSLFSLGQAIVIISGGIDLSVGSLLCFTGVLTIHLLNTIPGISFLQAAGLVLFLGAMIGLIHGSLICYFRLQPFLVTLCSLLILRGLSRVMTNDSTAWFNPRDYPLFARIGQETILAVPIPVYILLAALIPLAFFMHKTVPGRYMYAIGYNLEAARYSGIPVSTLRIASYMICSVLTTLAAFCEASSIGSIAPSSAGMAYEMYGITAAVLGGCALRGGQGSLCGVIIGASILKVIDSGVIFFGISTFWTFAVTGTVLLLAVIGDAIVKQRRATRAAFVEAKS